MKIEKWLSLMESLQLNENRAEYDYLITKHNESGRAYHNQDHITDCLDKLESLGDIPYKTELNLAFWYHDVIYNPYGKNNELKSAQKAVQFLMKQEVDEQIIKKVKDLIMATIHKDLPKNTEEEIIMDIDISILGSELAKYENYTKQVRSEYSLVPWFIYRKNRIKIMEMFLKREHLYYTEEYRCRYDEKARLNIAKEIRQLKG